MFPFFLVLIWSHLVLTSIFLIFNFVLADVKTIGSAVLYPKNIFFNNWRMKREEKISNFVLVCEAHLNTVLEKIH